MLNKPSKENLPSCSLLKQLPNKTDTTDFGLRKNPVISFNNKLSEKIVLVTKSDLSLPAHHALKLGMSKYDVEALLNLCFCQQGLIRAFGSWKDDTVLVPL